MVQKTLVAASACRQICCRFVLDSGGNGLHAPVVIVKIRYNSNGMVDGTMRARLRYWMHWQYFERTRWKLKPQDKPGKIVKRDLLPINAFLRQKFPILLEYEGI